jgi:hypothetical protein
MSCIEVRAQQVGLHKATKADQNEYDTEDLANRLCHDLLIPPVNANSRRS